MNQLMRLVTDLEKRNPGLTTENGSRHVKIKLHGRLIAILPYASHRKGLAKNTKAQLRRAGVQLPS